MRRCKQCKDEMLPAAKCTDRLGKQRLCSIDCATAWGMKASDRVRKAKQAKQDKKVRESLKTPTDYANEAQLAVNAWVRHRDRNDPCISCRTPNAAEYHAGHYRPRGKHAHLRFNLFNNHKQCARCNLHLSGNLTEYRRWLVLKIGVDRVERLENDNRNAKYSIDYLKRVKKIFTKRLRIHKSFSHNQ
jgi:hypothetical protein